jgi:hypothetical protein
VLSAIGALGAVVIAAGVREWRHEAREVQSVATILAAELDEIRTASIKNYMRTRQGHHPEPGVMGFKAAQTLYFAQLHWAARPAHPVGSGARAPSRGGDQARARARSGVHRRPATLMDDRTSQLPRQGTRNLSAAVGGGGPVPRLPRPTLPLPSASWGDSCHRLVLLGCLYSASPAETTKLDLASWTEGVWVFARPP